MKNHRILPLPSGVSNTWNIQDAKARLSELVDLAKAGNPQTILRRGIPSAMVISIEDYHSGSRSQDTLLSFLLNETPRGPALNLERSKDRCVSRVDFSDEAT